MDISTIVAAERAVEIKHPASGEPIGLRITVRPESDPAVVAARRRFLNDRLHRGGKLTAEKLEQQQNAVIQAAVSGWDWQGELTFEGAKPEFSEANLARVLKRLPWVKQQLDEELGDTAAFFPS